MLFRNVWFRTVKGSQMSWMSIFMLFAAKTQQTYCNPPNPCRVISSGMTQAWRQTQVPHFNTLWCQIIPVHAKCLKWENVFDCVYHTQGEHLLLIALFRKYTLSDHSPYCDHKHLASFLLSILFIKVKWQKVIIITMLANAKQSFMTL